MKARQQIRTATIQDGREKWEGPACSHLRLRGQWLDQAGFPAGQLVAVAVKERELIIRPAGASFNTPAATARVQSDDTPAVATIRRALGALDRELCLSASTTDEVIEALGGFVLLVRLALESEQ